jgi:GNAT superfamily N-acetyltransferase
MQEDGRETIVGGARYIVGEPGEAEVAFMVVDDYQGLGIGAALMAHLAAIAHAAGIRELIADVLSDNAPMLAVFKKSGFPLSTKRESGVLHVTIALS